VNDSAAGLRLAFDEVVLATGAAVVRAAPPSLVLEGIGTDSRSPVPGGLFVALPGERFDGADFAADAAAKGAAALLVPVGRAADVAAKAPGAAVLAAESTTRALERLAAWHRRRMGALVVAITGSNGKTTTREMTRAALAQAGETLANEGNLNNEVGAPLTMLALRERHRFLVLEIGMNHEGEIGRLAAMASPDVGVVTNAGSAHVEALGSVENVSRAKGELFHGMPLHAIAVANADDAFMRERARTAGRRTILFGRDPAADVCLVRIVSQDASGLRCELAHAGRVHDLRLPVVGGHNALNACAALAASTAAGIEAETALRGLAEARPPGRRLRLGPISGTGATLLDDCYNANPASTAAALATLCELAPVEHRLAVLGDMRELGAEEERGHREVGRVAAGAALRLLVAFGPASKATADAAREAGMAADRILHCDDPEAAADRVRRELRCGDLVLVKASRGTRLERVSDRLAPATGEAH